MGWQAISPLSCRTDFPRDVTAGSSWRLRIDTLCAQVVLGTQAIGFNGGAGRRRPRGPPAVGGRLGGRSRDGGSRAALVQASAARMPVWMRFLTDYRRCWAGEVPPR